jgi:hypothetical protein
MRTRNKINLSERQSETLTRTWGSGVLSPAFPNYLRASATAFLLSLWSARSSMEPRLTTPLKSSPPSRMSGLESSCLTMAPQHEASTSLLHPPRRSEATGHACVAPPTSSEQFLARRISFPRAPHGPSLPIAPPPPRRAPRLPLTPGRSTPYRRVPIGTIRQGGAQGKSRYRTTTQRHFITIIILLLLRGRLRGGFFLRETLEPLLATTF